VEQYNVIALDKLTLCSLTRHGVRADVELRKWLIFRDNDRM